jgi:hypothetical protein
LFGRLPDLVTPAECSQARVADVDPLGEQLLAHAHEISLAALVQLADLAEMLGELLVALQLGHFGDAATQDFPDRSARRPDHSGDPSYAVPLA